jgi:CDP-diacylglycerol--serine O-phosphatidyltransferase
MDVSKLRYLVPNSFTALSMTLGVVSAYLSTQGEFELAAWMITWGVLLDKLDGTTARLFKASSSFGVQFDSFADFIIFGLAPASLYYHWLGGASGAWGVTLNATIACMYIVITATRLSFFNVSEPPGGDRYFFGIPTTLSGAILATFYLTCNMYWPESSTPEALTDYQQLGLLSLLVLFAILMVSGLILPKLKPRPSRAVNIFQFTNVGLAYIFAPLMLFPHYLLSLCLLYVVLGLITGFREGIGESDLTTSEA